ncbi:MULTISPECIES: LysE family translocator [Pontibacillus]|uniref:LysE family translocator n=1 Tax=Pontibacillus chungwhensis TaxID=265426 RepID=A0ABY8UWD7_9BACI|nr:MULTISPECIES: LysE family translocator [Pontibacillus]MCD5325235.1 LysE family translocator [Pontibacillus sp. HN14]WIF97483.1 LysE family translocator [Pontibacillus chungwhensis]
MNIFVSYLLLGLSLSAPMGPINAAQLDKGIRFGFWHAWLIGVGGMVADGVFMLLIYFGVAQFIDTPILRAFLWSFGFFVLCYTGVESIAKSKAPTLERTETRGETLGKSFRTGFLMAISNPLSILFWLGIYGSILAQTTDQYGAIQILIYSSGIFLGITIWDITMAALATGTRRLVTPTIQQIISILSGLVLIGFGLYFGIQAFRLIVGG